jgi:HemK-related putative methylase
MAEIYEPSDDSYLMSETLVSKLPELLNKNSHLKLLEVGVGSGINLNAAMKSGVKKENIFGCDINLEAVKHCKSLGFNCVESDLFDSFKGGLNVKGNLVPLQFDIIIFNPPYLPKDNQEPESSKLATTGGKKGNEIIIKFLKQAKNHLSKNGKIFLITSTLSEKVDFENFGYKFKEIGSKNLFFEKLFVWELTPADF